VGAAILILLSHQNLAYMSAPRILHALAVDGLSNREIGDRLFLAYTTIKWYNRQIYNKLGVNTRQQAIERVHQLGLLVIKKPKIKRKLFLMLFGIRWE